MKTVLSKPLKLQKDYSYFAIFHLSSCMQTKIFLINVPGLDRVIGNLLIVTRSQVWKLDGLLSHMLWDIWLLWYITYNMDRRKRKARRQQSSESDSDRSEVEVACSRLVVYEKRDEMPELTASTEDQSLGYQSKLPNQSPLLPGLSPIL